MNLKYEEFPPAHESHNCHCVLPPENYNKVYQVSNYFSRNTQIADYADHIIAFVVEGIKANGTMDTVSKAKKLNKKVLVLKDS